MDYRRDRDLSRLVVLFEAAKEIKGGAVKYVAVSKALHHLLPDLVVPMPAGPLPSDGRVRLGIARVIDLGLLGSPFAARRARS